jgi:glycine betaine/choline ABC-type transport system substrate-binding protein
MDVLAKVRTATLRRRQWETTWKLAIRRAHADGASMREIADAAGVVHSRIAAIIHETTSDPTN